MAKRAITINLALQGGGAHGAFTWGVLDRLLEDEAIGFDWVSAASAGAVNAVAMLSGLADGGRAAARRQLAEVWEAVSKAGLPEFLRLNPFFAGLQALNAMTGSSVAGLLAPKDMNPFDFNPLRRILLDKIDFGAIAKRKPARLLIAATEIATGRPRLFREHELTVDVVLASACLPTLHRAVEIGGRHYWDGGFSANPDIRTLAAVSATRDTLLVVLNPARSDIVPRELRDITAETNRITFSQPLLRDVAEIAAVREAVRGFGGLWAPASAKRVARHRFHLIEAGAHTADLAPGSKLSPDWEMLRRLCEAGRREASAWLSTHRDDVGSRSTVDLAARFLA